MSREILIRWGIASACVFGTAAMFVIGDISNDKNNRGRMALATQQPAYMDSATNHMFHNLGHGTLIVEIDGRKCYIDAPEGLSRPTKTYIACTP